MSTESARNEPEPTRDERGRWLPGHCPNPTGRPRKKHKPLVDLADMRMFKNTLVDVRTADGVERMTRDAALLHKVFEGAMRGKVSMQKLLLQEFEKNDKRIAAARVEYERLLFEWIIDNPKFNDRDFEIPKEVDNHIEQLRALLNHYYPGAYGKVNGNDGA